jgi:hypothetical protein
MITSPPRLALTLITVLLVTAVSGQINTMTFNVDMNGIGFKATDTTLNVRIKGDLDPLNWVTGIRMTDDNNDGIYSTTVNFDTRKQQEVTFKYVLNNVEWEAGDNVTIILKHDSRNYNSHFRYNPKSVNPFRKFFGEWTLKDDTWEQGYDHKIEQVKIPEHYTLCKEINSNNSMLWIIESPSSKGNIFWSYNTTTNEAHWASSFHANRSGNGSGSINASGDATFKVQFEGEPEGTYRVYTYKWISDHAYELRSIQYNKQGKPTGSYYGGTFVRLNPKL